ncbi:MAG TPA: ATP-binding protein [Kofleriaceae bacterium]|nr:ATP-binding protein [Kofleriaceae bacterium]
MSVDAEQVLALGRAAAARLWLRLAAEGHVPAPPPDDVAALQARSAEVDALAAALVAGWPRDPLNPLGRLARWLGNDPRELTLVALAVAPHLDGALARSYDALSPRAGFTLGFLLDLAVADEAGRLALAARLGEPRSALAIGALEVDPAVGLSVTSVVRMPASIVAAVRGALVAPPPQVHEVSAAGRVPGLELAAIGLPDLRRSVLVVGPSPWAMHTIGRVLAGRHQKWLWTASSPPDGSLDAGWTRLVRDAGLAGALVACDLAPEREPDPVVVHRRLAAAVRASRRLDVPVLLYTNDEDPVPTSIARDVTVVPLLGLRPSAGTELAQVRLEQDGVANAAAVVAEKIAPLAVGLGQVEAIVEAHHRGLLDDPSPQAQAEVGEALRPRLGNLVERVSRRIGWDALVIPDDVRQRLREIVLYRRHAERVYREWGLGKHITGEGIAVLFSGPPGTGKTLAASVIATELGIALYRVDLSRIVSKWVGETEKNLGRLFAEARHGHAVLLFDEADALFGKRTEVKSSNDRYANLEVNFLLQKLDHFDGVAILTTNALQGIDEAFLRRLQFRVTFDAPDHDARVTLWQKHLPRAELLHEDVDLDEIADRYEFSGGNIRNAAIRAAFLAADAGGAITQAHLRSASITESEELGNVVKRSS